MAKAQVAAKTPSKKKNVVKKEPKKVERKPRKPRANQSTVAEEIACQPEVIGTLKPHALKELLTYLSHKTRLTKETLLKLAKMK